MIVANRQHGGYSAEVQMQLSVAGRVFNIGQLGPDFIILRDAADHPPAEAEITLSIDGAVERWRVLLPLGIRRNQTRTRIAAPAHGSTAG